MWRLLKIAAVAATATAAATAIDAAPYTVCAGEEWIPLEIHRDIDAGSALDFSLLGFTDAPAGKYGWLKNAGGHFEFEKLPGRPQRFYGVNLCGTGNFPDHALADVLVARFKRLGYNAIRLHHHDGGMVKGGADGLALDPVAMDRFDYLVAAAIREGLYVTTDLYVSRRVEWRQIGVDRDGVVDKQLFKALCAVYEPAYRNWAAYAENFLCHVNKYTGRRYADEPALALISLVNEGGFFMGWKRGVRDDPRILASWREWLAAKRAADPSFAPDVPADSLPENFPWDCSGIDPAVAMWTGELEAKMAARMKAHLRSLGAKALVTNGNSGPHYAALQLATDAYDYIDDHFYVDHPAFPEKPWSLPSKCPNVNPLAGDRPVPPSFQAFVRMLEKPFTVTEWNFSGPGRYRGMGGILTGAMAALQGWDGMWRFAYSHSRDALGDADVKSPGYFDLASDPLAQAGERACMCLFLRGDMKPYGDGVALWYTPESVESAVRNAGPSWRDVAWSMRTGSCLSPEGAGGLRTYRREKAKDAAAGLPSAGALRFDRERGSFAMETPRTCGGFAPEGAIAAGPLGVEVAGAPATVWVSSLDGADLPKSRRILLTHATDVQGDGAKYADEWMKTTLEWGTRPLARSGSARIELELERPEKYAVFGLSLSGARKERIPVAVRDGRLCFEVRTASPRGARMLYEIVR